MQNVYHDFKSCNKKNIKYLLKNWQNYKFLNKLQRENYNSWKKNDKSINILKNTKKYLCKKSIIVFDELYNFPGQDVGEYKALKETFSDNKYKFIGFALKSEKAVIQIL